MFSIKGVLSHVNVAEKANKKDSGDTGGLNCNLEETNFPGSLEIYFGTCLLALLYIYTIYLHKPFNQGGTQKVSSRRAKIKSIIHNT